MDDPADDMLAEDPTPLDPESQPHKFHQHDAELEGDDEHDVLLDPDDAAQLVMTPEEYVLSSPEAMDSALLQQAEHDEAQG